MDRPRPFFLLMTVMWVRVVTGQPQSVLPTPTGALSVGRVMYQWTDSTRGEELSSQPTDRRELMIEIWYPAQQTTPVLRSPYLPKLTILQSALSEEAVRKEFGKRYDETSNLQTHAVENAPFAEVRSRSPVLLFLPGLGEGTYAYTAQLEEYASHGYVVVAINPTFEVFGVVLSGDRVISRSVQGWEQARSKVAAEYFAFERKQLSVWAHDAKFVVDRLTELDRETRNLLAGHLDLSRLGVFGHSAGAKAAGLACLSDSRIKACVNQDGISADSPFISEAAPQQPFLYIHPSRLPPIIPTEEQLKQMNMTRADLERQRRLANTALQRVRGGSYEVILRTPGVDHGSFSDIHLFADTDAERKAHAQTMQIIRSYTLAFFERSLRGRTAKLLDDPWSSDGSVIVRRFKYVPEEGRSQER
jgi:pimeloyl-ACP methyl ester carboxylesterase